MQKLTQEYVKNGYKKHGYILLSKYENTNTKLCIQDKEGYMYNSTWDYFQRGKEPMKFHKSNPYTIYNIKLWMKINTVGYELLSKEYINSSTKLLFRCSKGHKFEITWNKFQQGNRCPYCSHQKTSEETCIYTVAPWMMKLGVSEEDAKKYLPQSNQKITVTCPHCRREKSITIHQIYDTKSISCVCGDSISYPEKFIISILNQLNIKYIKEYSPLWSNNKRYDFYLEDYNTIIECHGEQHYRYTGRGRQLQEEQENDKYKKQLALDNKIDCYIELDCSKSELEYIKNSILNSELSNLFDLNHIDWFKCEEYTMSNKVKEVCDYWKLHNEINNEDLSTLEISKLFNLGRCTIIRYLNKGSKLEWCNYDSKKESIKRSSKVGKSTGKPVEIFKNNESLGVFESCSELSRQSEFLFGVKLFYNSISLVCKGRQKQHKGFTFKYID